MRTTDSKPKTFMQQLVLAKVLLEDPFPQMGATHDIGPFGAYVTIDDGSVAFKRGLYATPRYVKCRSPQAVDRLVAKSLIYAAQHANRYLRVSRESIGFYLHRIKSERIFTGKKVLVPGGTVTKALPDNLIVSVSDYPENFGRLCFEDGSYGISILAPHALSVFEVMPPMKACEKT